MARTWVPLLRYVRTSSNLQLTCAYVKSVLERDARNQGALGFKTDQHPIWNLTLLPAFKKKPFTKKKKKS